MTLKSRRREVKAEIDRQLKLKNKAAAIVVQNEVKRVTPVGTAESTGIEGYVGGRLRDSIDHDSSEAGFVVGTDLNYGGYVHNGTYDFKQEQFVRLDSIQAGREAVAAAESATGEKGMRPRPYLAEGLINAVLQLRRIYGDQEKLR